MCVFVVLPSQIVIFYSSHYTILYLNSKGNCATVANIGVREGRGHITVIIFSAYS